VRPLAFRQKPTGAAHLKAELKRRRNTMHWKGLLGSAIVVVIVMAIVFRVAPLRAAVAPGA
jgi:hypothetical protein